MVMMSNYDRALRGAGDWIQNDNMQGRNVVKKALQIVAVTLTLVGLVGCAEMAGLVNPSGTGNAALMTALKAAVATLQPGMTGAQVTNALTLPGFENNPTMQVLLQVIKGKIEASRTGKAASADICGTALTFVGGVLTSVKTP